MAQAGVLAAKSSANAASVCWRVFMSSPSFDWEVLAHEGIRSNRSTLLQGALVCPVAHGEGVAGIPTGMTVLALGRLRLTLLTVYVL